MGSQSSDEKRELMKNELIEIFNYKCEILNIGNKVGHTSYIDFITEDELKDNNIMKGIDIYNRKFIIIRAMIILKNGERKKTFCTFFQRYNDNELLWHCCGHHGKNLMDTCGGMHLDQMIFLKKLLYDKSHDLNLENIRKNSLLCLPYKEQEQDDNEMPIQVIIE